VEVPFERGLLGHSDADVALHAIMDALLGAAALKDIGYHFPDSDPAYKGASSVALLRRVAEMLEEKMYMVSNIDCTIICQRPKLRPYLDEMTANVAEALGMEEDRVNIKATTEEGLGFTGTGEGISAQAVCLLENVLDGPVSSVDSDEDRTEPLHAGGCAACPLHGGKAQELLCKSEENSQG
jgi:2-C-methyl-D-erythritol 2,4-cyclodiphosphate synthase